jgi:hypothetical protein
VQTGTLPGVQYLLNAPVQERKALTQEFQESIGAQSGFKFRGRLPKGT